MAYFARLLSDSAVMMRPTCKLRLISCTIFCMNSEPCFDSDDRIFEVRISSIKSMKTSPEDVAH